MKRTMCGIVVLAAATALWSCNGDPTEDSRGVQRIVAEPSTVFVDQGASEFVIVEARDEQGNQFAADFQAQNAGAGITVVKDPTYLATTIGDNLLTSARFIVTGVTPGPASVEVVGGDVTGTVPVTVVPTSFGATVSNATPAQNEPITITLPAGYKFVGTPGVSTDQGVGIVQSVAVDSLSLVAVLPLGSSGALTVDSVQADFIPGVPLSIPTEATVTVDATPIAGTGSTATAPALPVPAIGGTTGFFDAGVFTAADITADGGVGAQYYRLVVTEAGDYTITTDWPATSAADIDAVLCPDAACTGGGTFAGSGTTHPEEGTLTLTPATYFLAVVLFSGAPTPFGIKISAAATPPPPAP